MGIGKVESVNKNLGGEKEKMKTKNKVLALLEIAVVLCSVFLVATLPAIAAGQTAQEVSASTNMVTTASEDDYVLGVYGNANEDDTIDMRDLTYVKLIFFGKKPETELADAKYDGKINPLDFIQIKLIIVGKEKELTIVDNADRIVTVSMPVERIVVLRTYTAEAVKIVGSADRVVGVAEDVKAKSHYFPVLSGKPSVGNVHGGSPDYEAMVALSPDLVISLATGPSISEIAEKVEPVPAVALRCYKQTLKSDIKKLGYILNKRTEAEEYNDWYKEHEDEIKSLVDGLTEEEKPRVFIFKKMYGLTEIATQGSGSTLDRTCTIAGGINIAGDLPISSPRVSWEWVLNENPDVIIRHGYRKGLWGWSSTDEAKSWIEDITSLPGAENIAAVKNNHVFVYSAELAYGPDCVAGYAYWAKMLHPEFDLDPDGIYREYLERFLGIEYPEDLIFVYPPLK